MHINLLTLGPCTLILFSRSLFLAALDPVYWVTFAGLALQQLDGVG